MAKKVSGNAKKTAKPVGSTGRVAAPARKAQKKSAAVAQLKPVKSAKVSKATPHKATKRASVASKTKGAAAIKLGGFLPELPHLQKKKLGVVTGSTDERRVVSPNHMDRFPFSAICKVRTTFSRSDQYGNVKIGTAWYVSPYVLLTAGHVLFRHDLGGSPTQVELWSPSAQNWTTVLNSKIRWTNDWEKYGENRSDRDFGAIKTSVVCASYFPLRAVEDDKALARCPVTVCGYPVDYQPQSGRTPVMVFATASECKPNKTTIDYQVDTMPGESGSPLFTVLQDGTAVGLGVHNYGEETRRDRYGVSWGPKNTATRITPAVKKEIEEWIAGL
jgi:V8-like Glu-specific endopeptidase